MRIFLALLLCPLAFGQVDATALRGKQIQNPLSPLDSQGLVWDTLSQRWKPGSVSPQNGSATYCPSSSASTTTYTCNLTPAISAYTTGMVIAWKPDLNNTGASTLSVNSLTAKAINKLSAGALVAVGADDISNQYIYLIRYNGTVFILESAGSGGGSASGGCAFTRTSGTVLTALSNATLTTTCKAGAQNLVYTFTAPATGTVSAGTSDVFVYVTAAGVLTFGHSGLTIVCSGCTAVTPITAFPQGVAKLYQWHVTAGVWDATGTDSTVNAQGDSLAAGSGILLATSSGVTTPSVDSSVIVQKFSGAGTPGSIASSTRFDLYTNTTNGDVYVCNNAGGACNGVGAGQWVIVTGSAGGSGINITREETSAIAMTGSDVDIYSVSVPALAAGKGCSVTWGIETSVAANVQMKVKFGSDTLASLGAIVALGIWKHQMELFNIAADNTHQRLISNLGMLYQSDTTFYVNFTSAATTFTQNWGSAVTLKISATSGTGGATVTGRWLRVHCP